MPANIKNFLEPLSPEESAAMDQRQSRRQEWIDYFDSPDTEAELLIDFLEGTRPIPEPSVSTKQQEPDTGEEDVGAPWNDRSWSIFADTLGGLESSNRFDISGGHGGHYDGKWQLGRLAKLDAGARLGIELGHDPASREAFRNDPDLQERAFEAFTQSNHDTLMRISSRYRGMSRNEKLAVLSTAHLLGAGGAKEFLNGIDGADANGTKASQYYEAILTALKQ